MKKIILITAATAAALALASCEDNDVNIDSSSDQPLRISASIGETTSRAHDTSWSAGDKIGILSSVGTMPGPYINLEYTTDTGNGFFTGTPMFYYKPMTLIAYYPFTGSEDTDPGVITARTDADNQVSQRQVNIDFLWDSKTNEDIKDFSAANPEITFTFSHKMSKLTFAFIGTNEVENEEGVLIAEEVKASDIVAYEIEGLVMEGTFDTSTGICAIGSSDPENLKIEFEKGTVKDEKVAANAEELPPLIVFPQKPGNSTVKLHVYTDELDNPDYLQHYVCTLTFGDGELKPGNCYKYTIQISKVGLQLKTMTIENWIPERDVNVTATIDGGVEND